MDLFIITGILHLIVGIGYATFSLLVLFFGSQILKWLWPETNILKIIAVLSIIGTVLFLVGCGEHHIHLGYHLFTEPYEFDRDFVLHMFWDSLAQAIGVWGPIPLVLFTRTYFIKLSKKYGEKMDDVI